MRTIDRYIIRKFLGTFFFTMVLLMFIVIVFDISEKIDDFLRHDAPLKAIIFDYYVNFVPYFMNLFSYLLTFIAVIFFTSRMASNSEIIAILSSGISFRRLLFPYFISAVVLGLFSFLLANFVIPYTNRGMHEFEKKYINDPREFTDQNVHKQISPGSFIYLENFNIHTGSGWKFSVEKFRDQELIYKLKAERLEWDSIRSHWIISNYYIRTINGMEETLKKGAKLDTVMPFTPSDFMEDIEDVKIMNYFALRKQIKEKELRGDPDVIKYKVKGYERMAFPFATIILTVIGVSVSSRKVRGGIGFHLGSGLALTFIYILFMQIFTVFATFGDLPPLIAVWIPNIIFGIIAFFLLKIAPK
ncbi:MAG: LptF/LptG family permease [Bacteroidales bacterium]|nr:LptF/LptG family permease [Bacteroidales bacterium]HNW75139.1 LptF/LptG family permease [Bacteroidales bacterium]HPS51866.1 LptF/LptG family permease [Bacteroidales bacterium]